MPADTLPTVRGENRHRFQTPYPFEPTGTGLGITPAETSAALALPLRGDQLLLTNRGTIAVFIEFGSSGVVATMNSLCILPSTQVLITIPLLGADDRNPRATHCATITASGTGAGTLQVSAGWGC